MKKYNVGHVQKSLDAYVAKNFTSKSRAADKLKISRSYLSQIIHGHSPMPDWVAEMLGYSCRVETYYTKRLK